MLWEVIEKNKRKSSAALVIMGILASVIDGVLYAVILCIIVHAAPIFAPHKIEHYTNYNITISHETVMDEMKTAENTFKNKLIILYIYGIAAASLIFFLKTLYASSSPWQINDRNIYKAKRTLNKQLYNIVEEIGVSSGLAHLPNIYILNSNILNAYTCGINPNKSAIVISKGLIELLNRDEMQGVIAHEISHILNRDTMYIYCAGILNNNILSKLTDKLNKFAAEDEFNVKSICFLTAFVCLVVCFYNWDSSEYLITVLILANFHWIVYLFINILNFIIKSITNFMFKFISKSREYLADACAVLYTRNPAALASAVQKIEELSKNNIFSSDVLNANQLVKASFFAPVEEDETHPETENRIKILSEMKTADLNEYERIYEKLKGKNLLPKSALKDKKILPVKATEKELNASFKAMQACSLGITIDNKEQTKILRENKALLNENIKKHREIENLVRDLAEYKVINCECGTKLKIPPVYKNQIIICPHCGKKHTV